MRKGIFIFIALILFTTLLSGTYRYQRDFLATADAEVTTGDTEVNVTDFTSREIKISRVSDPETVAITVTFARATGSAATVDFAFEASFDGGRTWATFEGVTIKVASNHSVISGTTVRVITLVNTPGVSHLRLKSIKNNDSGSVTACNATLSM